jgi:hypothetical protein
MATPHWDAGSGAILSLMAWFTTPKTIGGVGEDLGDVTIAETIEA